MKHHRPTIRKGFLQGAILDDAEIPDALKEEARGGPSQLRKKDEVARLLSLLDEIPPKEGKKP